MAKVLVIRRVHVAYRLKLPASRREASLRVHGVLVQSRPIARSVEGCIAITTELFIEEVHPPT